MTDTKAKLLEMLTANTGTHMLDSGGAYGRNWEKNRVVNPFDRPPVSLYVYKDDLEVTINVAHFLLASLEYNNWAKKETEKYYAWCEAHDEPRWLPSMEDYTGKNGYNTYNGECLLSQTLQFVLHDPDYGFDEGEEHCMVDSSRPWIMLQIHGGCDVRGGYTDPVIFEIVEEHPHPLRFNDVYVRCPECYIGWYTDDGWNWYHDDGQYEWEEVIRDEDNNKLICPECKEELEVVF